MTSPERIQVTRWRCTHCGRSWSSRRVAREHAERCWYDPANRACKTCEHFDPGYHRGEHSDVCRAGMRFFLIERWGRVTQTLHVGCALHRVSDSYMHPDVLDALDEASTAT